VTGKWWMNTKEYCQTTCLKNVQRSLKN
jgi:hypothetical protein